MNRILNFFKALGLFKSFFLVVLPLVFVFFCLTSLAGGNLGYDLNGYLLGFGLVYIAVAVVVLLNRKTK